MRNISKKIVGCILSGIFVCQSLSLGVVNNSALVAQAHSGHREDWHGHHNENRNTSGADCYYYCDGNPAHLHDGGSCPYTSVEIYTGSEATINVDQNSAAVNLANSADEGVEVSSGINITVSKDLIKIIQAVLNQKGYSCGTVDGVAGTKTKESLKKFLEEQKDSNTTDHLILSILAAGLGIE